MPREAVDILCNRLINIFIDETGGECPERFKYRVESALADFTIGGRETAISEYTGDITASAVEAFCLDKIASGMSRATVYAYKTHLFRIFSTIGKTYSSVTAFDVRAYLARRRLDGIAQTTIRNEFAYLSSFYTFLAREGICDNVMLRVAKPKKADVHKDAFSDREIELIRLACQNDRQKAVIELLLSTGCRISEVCGIRLTDIQDGRIKVLGKGNKERYVYLNARAQLAVENYIGSRKYESVWLFYANGRPDDRLDVNSLRLAIEKVGDQAGVSPCNPHRFRHYYATHMASLGMDIGTVSKSMGHASIATTQVYIDISDDQVEQAHRRFA